MWLRFTEMARKVVFFAQEEAQGYRVSHIGTEHLLLGLVREETNTACKILLQLGVSLEGVRRAIQKLASHGDVNPIPHMTLTTEGRNSVELAFEEANELGHNYIGTEHLLLGILREEGGVARAALSSLGVEFEASRSKVVLLQSADQREP